MSFMVPLEQTMEQPISLGALDILVGTECLNKRGSLTNYLEIIYLPVHFHI
jgi:hypothetical protein